VPSENYVVNPVDAVNMNILTARLPSFLNIISFLTAGNNTDNRSFVRMNQSYESQTAEIKISNATSYVPIENHVDNPVDTGRMKSSRLMTTHNISKFIFNRNSCED